jgi:hypothetical protein
MKLNTRSISRHSFLAVAASLAMSSMGFAQSVNYSTTGSIYSQNFDGLPTTGTAIIAGRGPHAIEGQLGSTGMTGWHMTNDRGSSTATEFRAQDGSLSGSSGRGVVSFGTTASTDRALGTLGTSNQISAFGLYLTNTTGQNLSQVTLNFTGEQWRVGDAAITAETLAFSYAVFNTVATSSIGLAVAGFNAVSALDFNAPFTGNAGLNNSALDGNNATYQASLGQTFNVNWAPNQVLVLQWVGQDLSGQDHGLGIDNLNFSAIPEPSTYALLAALATMGAVSLRRRFAFRA